MQTGLLLSWDVQDKHKARPSSTKATRSQPPYLVVHTKPSKSTVVLASRYNGPIKTMDGREFRSFNHIFSVVSAILGAQRKMADDKALSVNDYRTIRVAQILDDFRTLQYYIAAAPTEPTDNEDHYTEGWAALRQCAIDGQHILDCAADTTVPTPQGGEDEQSKAELRQCVYSQTRVYCEDASS